jgi:hypothetical protein
MYSASYISGFSPISFPHCAESILRTPLMCDLKRRPYWGRFKPSSDSFMRDLQRMIRLKTRSRRICSFNKLAGKAGVDRKLIMRILENKGCPNLSKVSSIAKACGNRLNLVKLETDDDDG